MSIFNTVLVRKPKRSKFNLSHEVKLSCNAGKEIPFLCQEVLPNEDWSITTEALVKAAPLIAPLMHQVNLKIEYWYVPNRIVWPNWENYINPKTADDEALQLPQIYNVPSPSLVSDGSLWDYLGLPSLDAPLSLTPEANYGINALPFLAYQMIWNEFYRDPNLQNECVLPHMNNHFYDGDISRYCSITDIMQLNYRCWEKDYFTTAQPDTQRGDDVMLNLSGNATFETNNFPGAVGPALVRVSGADGQDSFQVPDGSFTISPFRSGGQNVGWQITDANNNPIGGVQTYPQAVEAVQRLTGHVDMDSGISINDLRELNTLQKYKEILQLAGTRYTDWLKSIFGITSDDARLQRPQFLGGGRVPLTVGETLQHSQTTETSPQGNQSGNFYALAATPRAKFRVKEHGYIIGLLCVIPRTSYYQGIPRTFTKFDRYDFAIPMFANLGEQEVRDSEVWCPASSFVRQLLRKENKGGLFGYQQRYAEYKYIPSSVHGLFRSSLEAWQWGRKFETQPRLGSNFVTCDPDYRPFAVEDENLDEHFYIQLYNHVGAIRPLPRIAVPKL